MTFDTLLTKTTVKSPIVVEPGTEPSLYVAEFVLSTGFIHSSIVPLTVQVNTTLSPVHTGKYEGKVCCKMTKDQQ